MAIRISLKPSAGYFYALIRKNYYLYYTHCKIGVFQ